MLKSSVVSCFNELSLIGQEKLWIEFGVGINKRWTPIHDLTSVLVIKSAGLLFWYAITGCDVSSAFGGKGKVSGWTTWRVFDDITHVFEKYSHHSQRTFTYKKAHTHTQVQDEDIRILERFTCLLYSRATTFESVSECRHHLFTKQGRQVDTIPPTKNALLQHIKRGVFFFFVVFFHEHSPFTGQQGKGEAISLTPLSHFHQLYRHKDINCMLLSCHI